MSESNPATESDSLAIPARGMNAFPIRLLLPLVLFGTYPLALVFGVGVPSTPGRVFGIALPSFALLTLVAIPYLLGCGYRGTGSRGRLPAKWVPSGVLAFLVVYTLSAVVGKSVRVDQIVATMGVLLLPVFFAVVPRNFLPKRLPLLFASLWAVNVIHSLVQVLVKGNVVALAGNLNWAATLLACLVPWVWVSVRKARRPVFWLVVLTSSTVTGWLVWRCHCRATWLALGTYGGFFLLTRVLRGYWRVVAALVILGLGAAAVHVGRSRLNHAIAEDIRLPLYERVYAMTFAHPLLGYGPGNFRREFAGHRSREHLARRVAASVTEHPHNEVLLLAFELGWPVAIVWVALISFAIFVGGRGGGALRQACQFSAFLLFFHGMLDKPLAMPPTSLLAVVFAGLLLRWRLPVRLMAPPAGGRRRVQVGLAALAVAVGGYLTFTVVWRGTLFRRAAIAERAGFPQTAYQAYAESARIAPWDVRTHAYAGICAIKQLGDPALAWDHLYRAWQMEPDFAHINREMGRCLVEVNERLRALRFFMRETELFPFSRSAWRHLFVCGVQTGGLNDLGMVQDELNRLRLRYVCQQLGAGDLAAGRDEAKRLAAAFALAAEGGEPGQDTQALVLAGRLSAGLVLAVPESARAVGNPRQYSMLDVAFWQVRLKWRNAWLHCDREDPAALLAAWNRLDKDYRQVGFAEFAESAGWRTLVAATSPETVEMRRGNASFLVVPETGRIQADARLETLLAKADVRQGLGVALVEDPLPVSVLVGELRLYDRTQYLGYVLHALLPETMPDLYRSPHVMLYAAALRLQAASPKVTLRVQAVDE